MEERAHLWAPRNGVQSSMQLSHGLGNLHGWGSLQKRRGGGGGGWVNIEQRMMQIILIRKSSSSPIMDRHLVHRLIISFCNIKSQPMDGSYSLRHQRTHYVYVKGRQCFATGCNIGNINNNGNIKFCTFYTRNMLVLNIESIRIITKTCTKCDVSCVVGLVPKIFIEIRNNHWFW